MSVTSDFLKLRSTGTPKIGEWNINYSQALTLAKQGYKFIVTCWSNGDMCSFCTKAEKCMMQQNFIDWMKTSDAYFVFQYSGDPDKGKTVHDWIYNGTKITQYPGYRITLYDPANPNKIVVDRVVDGNTLRGNKANQYGAQEMINYLNAVFALKPARATTKKAAKKVAKKTTKKTSKKKATTKATAYKIRFNEKISTKKVNKILDAIDANDGYCPCQVRAENTKCHCEDFIFKKPIGEPCICNLYVKQSKS